MHHFYTHQSLHSPLIKCAHGFAGGHINPAVTFGLFLARKVSLIRALLYMIAQCLGAICGVGLVKGFQRAFYVRYGGGANELADGYSKGTGLAAEIIGTFVLVYTVFAATDPKRNARDSHVPVTSTTSLPPSLVSRQFRLKQFIGLGSNWCFSFIGLGSTSNWFRCVHGSLGHHTYYWDWNQPC